MLKKLKKRAEEALANQKKTNELAEKKKHDEIEKLEKLQKEADLQNRITEETKRILVKNKKGS